MPNPYFRQVPDFEYVSRLPNAKISDYIRVKNLFKRGKLADDIFPNLNFFTKYQVEGDDRPDNVAYKVYNESSVDNQIPFAVTEAGSRKFYIETDFGTTSDLQTSESKAQMR